VIRVLPYMTETIVTTLSKEDVHSLFIELTAISVMSDANFRIPTDKKFYGVVSTTHFQLALKNSRLFSFCPIVNGSIEATKRGTIIFLTYQLFKPTQFLLFFWTVFLFLTAIFLFAKQQDFYSGIVCINFLVGLHVIAHANFKQQKKPLQEAIANLLKL
jgi:hypothetical protein